jgi:hypothetical protein
MLALSAAATFVPSRVMSPLDLSTTLAALSEPALPVELDSRVDNSPPPPPTLPSLPEMLAEKLALAFISSLLALLVSRAARKSILPSLASMAAVPPASRFVPTRVTSSLAVMFRSLPALKLAACCVVLLDDSLFSLPEPEPEKVPSAETPMVTLASVVLLLDWLELSAVRIFTLPLSALTSMEPPASTWVPWKVASP